MLTRTLALFFGIVVPGLITELTANEVPEHLQPYWQPDFWTFHSAQWWKQLWNRSGTTQVDRADFLEDGWREWALWSEVWTMQSCGEPFKECDNVADVVLPPAGHVMNVVAYQSSDGAGVPVAFASLA